MARLTTRRWANQQIGHGVERHIEVLGWHITMSRAVGEYGYRHTVSWGVRWWRVG